MKRTSLAKRNALFSPTNVSWGSAALVVAVLILLARLLTPNFFWYVVAPVLRGADALTVRSHILLSGFGNTAILTLQNEQLINENATLASENQALLEKEKSLGELSISTPKDIIAGVLAQPPASPYDTFLLSKGSNQGVAVGQEVFGAGGVPLGIISSVLSDFSRATLFSAPGMAVNGWVGHANLPLIIEGAGAGAMRASLARSAGVVIGDEVFVPGPGALPIGTVTGIDGDPSSPVVTLQIQSALNLFSVTWVELRTINVAIGMATSTNP